MLKPGVGALLLLASCVLFTPLATAGSPAGYQVVVHPSNDVSVLTKSQLSQMLLKKVTRWPSGKPVRPVDLHADAAARRVMSKDVHGRSVRAVKAYWQRQIFTGRGAPPPEKPSDSAVIAYVRRNPGAVGYVSTSASVGTVKVITVE